MTANLFRCAMLAFALIGSACGDSANSLRVTATAEVVPTPRGVLSVVAWPRSDVIALNVSLGIWVLSPDGRAPEPLRITLPGPCDDEEYSHPSALSDGRLGLVRTCDTIDDPEYSAWGQYIAYDFASEKAEVLVPNVKAAPGAGPPEADFPINPGIAAWSPDRRTALIVRGNTLCSRLAIMTSAGVWEFPVELTDDHGRRWRFDHALWDEASEPCVDDIRTGVPAWSPNSDLVAAFADTSAVGVMGPDRSNGAADLYLITVQRDEQGRVTSGDAERILDGVLSPAGLAFSPDGKYLAVAGEIGGAPGAHLYELATGRLHRIDKRNAGPLAWDPGGGRLAGIVSPDGRTEELVIWTIHDRTGDRG